MKYRDVESSNIHAIGYDDENGWLGVEFLSERRFAYLAPRAMFDEMDALAASGQSVGRYFALRIKGHCAVAWEGYRCRMTPCPNDATQSAVTEGGTTVHVCDDCAKHPRLAGIVFKRLADV